MLASTRLSHLVSGPRWIQILCLTASLISRCSSMDPSAALAAFQQMQQQINALQLQLAHQPPGPHVGSAAAAGGASQVDRPRLPPPSQYDGRSAAALDGWLRELQQQFEWYGMADDASRLRFAGALLKGVALDWWASLVDAGGAALPSDATRPTTYDEFVTRLRGRFQPVNSAQTARLQLDDLRQGAKQSVHDYISAFRALLVRVPHMDEGDRVHRFLRGLRPNVATQLRVHGVSTLDAAIAMAARVGSIVEFGAPSASGPSPASAAAAGADDMQLDNIEGLDHETNAAAEGTSSPVTQAQLMAMLNAMRNDRSSNRPKDAKSGGKDVTAAIGKRFRLTPEQVREHFDKGQCFNCDGTGHSSRACPKPLKKN